MRHSGEAALTPSARNVLRQIVSRGTVTRPWLGETLGLSRPTVSTATAELERADLVVQTDVSKGPTGRSAAVYSLSPRAGYVVGVDVGSTTIRLVATSLDGTLLTERSHRRTRPGRIDASTALAPATRVVRHALGSLGEGHGPLRAVGVAIPNVVTKEGVPHAEGGAEWQGLGRAIADRADVPAETPVHMANNVNCSALAEHQDGCAVGCATSVYLQVGVNIGLGIVVDGRLLTGANGVAGELAGVPFPWRPGARYEREAMEHHVGADGWMARVHADWRDSDGPRPASPVEVFAAAEAGSPRARRLVAAQAQEVGRLAAAVVSILDPGLVVLGGGVGQHPMIASGVQEFVDRLPWPTRVRSSTVGATATARGVAHLAARDAMTALLGP